MKRGANGDARLAALALLEAVLDQGSNLADSDEGLAIPPRDRAFARHLAYGVLRWLSALEWLAARLLNKALKRKDRDVMRLILLGLFQLWQDGSAQHAAINETAECARKRGKPWAVGLINAVLRRFQREQDALLGELDRTDARLAHPPWLLEALAQDWPDRWTRIARANNRPAPLWLRLNARHDGAASLAQLTRDGLAVSAHPMVAGAVRVDPPRAVERLPGFADGRLSVQDPAAQLAAGLLDLRPGDRVLDACAAPGGKTCHLLEIRPDIRLTALDRSARRLERVRENLQRLELDGNGGSVRLVAADATQSSDWWDGRPFDRILLDAPCTASGVIRRHPEIKWLRTPEQLAVAVAQQRRLLDALWPLLAPGGMLLYATCSVLNRENSEQIRGFLQRHAAARAPAMDVAWGESRDPGRQILPGEHDMDGFYYALLRQAG